MPANGRQSIRVDPEIMVRRPLDMRAASLMLLFCLALGLQQVAIKAVAEDISPLAQIGIRSGVATLLVFAVAWWQRIALWVPQQFLHGFILGIGFTLEFAFVALGLNFTYAAHMSVFLYTGPVFAAIGLHFFVAGEQLALRHWLGVAIAFVGMMFALSPSGELSAAVLLGDALGVAGGLAWGLTTVALRTSVLSEAPPLRVVSYQSLTATVCLLPAAALLGDLATIHMTRLAWLSMTFQTLAVAFGVLLLWFWLLRRYLASRLGVFAFLSPIFGVVFGVLLMDDPISVRFAAGGLAIMAGLLLVNSRSRQPSSVLRDAG